MAFFRISNRGVGAGIGPFALYSGGGRKKSSSSSSSSRSPRQPTKAEYREQFISNVVRVMSHGVGVGDEFDLETELSAAHHRKCSAAFNRGEHGEAAAALFRGLVATYGDTKDVYARLAARSRSLRSNVEAAIRKRQRAARAKAREDARTEAERVKSARRAAKAQVKSARKSRKAVDTTGSTSQGTPTVPSGPPSPWAPPTGPPVG